MRTISMVRYFHVGVVRRGLRGQYRADSVREFRRHICRRGFWSIRDDLSTDIQRSSRPTDDGNVSKKGTIEVIFGKYKVNS